MSQRCRALTWIGRSQRDFKEFPQSAQDEFLLDLQDVVDGYHPTSSKPLQGFGGASVQELRASDRAGTYRVVYTVRIEEVVCVLHAFQQKSTSGIKTSRQDLDIIKARLAQAEREYGR